jgi:hypothetical protein
MRARDQAAADASGPSTDDPTARVVCTRGMAAGTPEGGGARRLARQSWPNLSSRARFGARTGSTRRGGRGELTQGLREMATVTAAAPRDRGGRRKVGELREVLRPGLRETKGRVRFLTLLRCLG